MRAALALALLLLTSPALARDTATVFAAASLAESFKDVGQVLEKSGKHYRFNFAGSQQLAAQLEQGAPADVFASADELWMRYAHEHDLVGDARLFTRNRLVVITPRGNPGRVDRLEDLGCPGVKVLIGVENVPIGRYARQVLTNLSRENPDFSRRVLANVVSQEENVKAIVTKVALGEADAGFVYVSDITPAVRGKVRRLSVPDDANVIAAYPIAVAKNAPHAEAAQAFVDFLLTREGQAILVRHGFLPAEDSRP